MYIEQEECLACGKDWLGTFLNLGKIPLANDLQTEENSGNYFPLEVSLCNHCSHVQLNHIVDPKILYENYKYVSGTTQTLKDHFKELVEYCNPNKKDLNVLDIGSNDHTLLEIFAESGCVCTGVDPAKEISQKASKRTGIPTFISYWNKDSVIGKAQGRLGVVTHGSGNAEFDVITGVNVFAHNPDPLGFLTAAKRHLKPGGKIVIEVPYAANTFAGEPDLGQIYHEHYSYWNVKSMLAVVERAELYISDIKEYPIHGGSIAFTLTNDNPNIYKITHYLENEKSLGLDYYEVYHKFARDIEKTLQRFSIEMYMSNMKLVGYAASAKATTVLNYMKNERILPHISYIVDDNPAKWGMFIPGTNIQIGDPEWLKAETEDIIVPCFAANFLDEIKRRLSPSRGNLQLITYSPKVRILQV